MFLVLSCSCLCAIHWSQTLSREWRCGWNSTDRWCSNYIWVISNFIACQDAAYIIEVLPFSGTELSNAVWYYKVQCIQNLQSITVECCYNIVQYNKILHCIITRTEAEYQSGAEPTKDNPYLALMGEVWGIFCEYFWENWQYYNQGWVSSGRNVFLPGRPEETGK